MCADADTAATNKSGSGDGNAFDSDVGLDAPVDGSEYGHVADGEIDGLAVSEDLFGSEDRQSNLVITAIPLDVRLGNSDCQDKDSYQDVDFPSLRHGRFIRAIAAQSNMKSSALWFMWPMTLGEENKAPTEEV